MNIKKRYVFLVCLFLLVSIIPTAKAAPADIPLILRIGITDSLNKQEIYIKTNSLTVGYENGSNFIALGTVTASSGFSVVPVNMYYVKLEKTYDNLADCQKQVNTYRNQGYKAMPCPVDFTAWAVYLGGYASSGSANEIANKFNDATVMAPNAYRIALLDGNAGFMVFENKSLAPQFKGTDGIIQLTNKYRNRIEFYRSGSTISAISVCTMQEYLYGVVPAEMPVHWHIEALKAQACAARTYAITRMTAHTDDGYQLCDGVHCQVYYGYSRESEQSNLAVDATRDLLIFYNDEPINAVFCSSAGGATDDSENVWTQTIPYLRSVADIYDTQGKQWKRTFTKSQINSLLTTAKASIGTCVSMEITKTNINGRVLELAIHGTNGTKLLKNEEIRNFFTPGSDGILESRFFMLSDGSADFVTQTQTSAVSVVGQTVSVPQELSELFFIGKTGTEAMSTLINPFVVSIVANNPNVSSLPFSSTTTTGITGGLMKCSADSITIIGRGNGHGVGLSQYGAKGMAESGFTFDEILKFYYTGVVIR